MSRLTVEDIHKKLCEDAAKIANEDPRKPHELRNARNLFFERSSKNKLSIDYDDALLPHIEPQRRDMKRTLHRIGRDALSKAIRQNAEVFVGGILDDARKGENYFDRWQGD